MSAAGEASMPPEAHELVRLLTAALDEQRASFKALVNDDVLQLACAARQDLQEIHSAQPSAPLEAALRNVTETIEALRRLIEREATVDAGLVGRARVAIASAFVGRG